MQLVRTAALTAVVLAATFGTAHAQFAGNFNAKSNAAVGERFVIEIAGDLWNPDPAITIATDALTFTGTNSIDFVTELGIQPTRFRNVGVTLKAGRKHKLRFAYTPITYDASTTIRRSFVFNGRTYDIGIPVNTTVDWKFYRFGYEWDIVSRDRGFFGVLGELKYNDITATLASPIGTETAQQTAPVPTIGAIGRGYLVKNLSATVEVSGFKLTRAPDQVKWVDVDVYGTFNVTKNIGARGGYRSIHPTYTVSSDSGDLKLQGPYFGAVVRF